MKKLICIALIAGWGHCFAQKHNDHLTEKSHTSKQFTVAANSTLAVYNVFGAIKVEGYSGSQVMIEVDQTIEADDSETLAQAKREFKLGFDQKTDSVIAYTAEPYDTRPHQRWDDHHNREQHYIVRLNYTVKVPSSMNLRVSTVNDGDINIRDVHGALNVNNVNGAISIANAKGTTDAHTINGDLTVTYLASPPDASNYYTLNGKLEVVYPPSFAGDVQFKSMNGEFFTDFNDTQTLPTEVVKSTDKHSNGTTYKLNKNTKIRIGAGGKTFKFETLNGNIYIKKA